MVADKPWYSCRHVSSLKSVRRSSLMGRNIPEDSNQFLYSIRLLSFGLVRLVKRKHLKNSRVDAFRCISGCAAISRAAERTNVFVFCTLFSTHLADLTSALKSCSSLTFQI